MLLFWYINFCECKRHWFPITGHTFIVVINIRNVDISGTFFVKLRKKNTIVKWVAFGDTACCHQVREWVKLLSYLNEKSNNYRYLKWINKLFMYFKVWRRQIKFYNMPRAKRKYIYRQIKKNVRIVKIFLVNNRTSITCIWWNRLIGSEKEVRRTHCSSKQTANMYIYIFHCLWLW